MTRPTICHVGWIAIQGESMFKKVSCVAVFVLLLAVIGSNCC